MQNVKGIEAAIRDAETSGDTAGGTRDRRKRASSPMSHPQVFPPLILLSHDPANLQPFK